MAFDWQGLVALARRFEREAVGAADSEALHRSAVSRAYFGAYCHSRNYAKAYLKFDPKEDSDDHGRLRAHLVGKRRQNCAKHLERLRQWRNDADYQNDLPWKDIAKTVASALQEADAVFAVLLPPSSTSGS